VGVGGSELIKCQKLSTYKNSAGKQSISYNEGGHYGSGPIWFIEDGELIYFAIFNKHGTGFCWGNGNLRVLFRGKDLKIFTGDWLKN
jgi:hypothetical protein